MSTKSIHTDGAPQAIGPYSQGMVGGQFLFTSGQIPLAADGTLVQGDIAAQTEQVFRNLRAILSAAGARLEDVVKATVFLKDMNDFVGMNKVYESAFGAHKPARSTVEVARLPRDARVEIEVIARLP